MYQMQAAAAELLEHFEFALPEEKMHIRRVPAFLMVPLVEGKEIHGVDRSGKSDPFVVFTLNDQKVYKSEVIKKTLAPQWKESFEVTIVCGFCSAR